MDDAAAVRAALERAFDDVQRAVLRIRAAQGVDWVSVFASRYREELYRTIRELAALGERLDDARRAAL
ncbi:MAG: hypothetical protein NVV57_05870 [Demequina sp.]|jgi:hypothetical protein|nr:hypothetical protein [Demequina sp.]